MIDSKKYLVAFVITALIFGTAVVASSMLTDKKLEDVRDIENRVALDILSSETQFALLEETSCKDIGAGFLSKELGPLGEDARARLRAEKVGFVFQFFHLIPSLTALENVMVPMEIAGRRDAAERARALLDEVGLSERGHHYPTQLSGGEQQRVALARALSNEPAILLADEPTGNLDSVNGRHILDLIVGIHDRRRTTVVLVTHDSSLAAMMQPQLVLRDGRIDAERSSADLVGLSGGGRPVP